MFFAYVISLIIILIGLIMDQIYKDVDEYIGSYEGGFRMNEISPDLEDKDYTLVDFLEMSTEGLPDENAEVYKNLFKKAYNKKGYASVVKKYEDIEFSLPYCKNTRFLSSTTCNITRKSILSEIRFLSETAISVDESTYRAIVIYIGAAPGNHFSFLSRLFPDIKFVLIDPNNFTLDGLDNPTYLYKRYDLNDSDTLTRDYIENITQSILLGSSPIYIINTRFDSVMAEVFNEAFKNTITYCILDIRTNKCPSNGFPDAPDILWNYALQYIWLKKLKPHMALVKFRHPFYSQPDNVFLDFANKEPYKKDFEIAKNCGIDFIENFRAGKKLEFFDGELQILPWNNKKSTETRLVTRCKTTKIYYPREYENKFSYYNNISRWAIMHNNNNICEEIGFDYCNDCALENFIWESYFLRYGHIHENRNVIDFVKSLTNHIGVSLLKNGHGWFYEKYTPNELVCGKKTMYSDKQAMCYGATRPQDITGFRWEKPSW